MSKNSYKNIIYRTTFKGIKSGLNYRLEIFASHTDQLNSPTYVDLPNNIFQEQIDYAWETEYGFGLTAPTMTFKVNTNNAQVSDFVRMLIDYKFYYVENWNPDWVLVPGFTGANPRSTINFNVLLGNVFNLYVQYPTKNNTEILLYSGVQQSGIDGNYEDGILTVETVHVYKSVFSELQTSHLLGMKEYYSHSAYNAYIDHYSDNTVGGALYKCIFTGTNRQDSKYFFWFTSLENVQAYMQVVANRIFNKLTRNTAAVLNVQHPLSELRFYKQTYKGLGTRGAVLGGSGERKLLTYYTDKDYSAYSPGDDIEVFGGYFSQLVEDYSNLWDYFVDVAESNILRAIWQTGSTNSFLFGEAIFNQYVVTFGRSDLWDVQFDSPDIIRTARASFVERKATDSSSVEVVENGSRASESFVLPTVHRTSVTYDDARKIDASGWNLLTRAPASWFVNNVVSFGRTVSNNQRWYNIFYLDEPETSWLVAMKVHGIPVWDIGFDSTTTSSDDLVPFVPTDISSLILNEYNNGIVKLLHDRDEVGLVACKVLLKLFSSDGQNRISATTEYINGLTATPADVPINLFNHYSIGAVSFDVNLMATTQTKNWNIFSTYDTDYIVTSARTSFVTEETEFSMISFNLS